MTAIIITSSIALLMAVVIIVKLAGTIRELRQAIERHSLRNIKLTAENQSLRHKILDLDDDAIEAVEKTREQGRRIAELLAEKHAWEAKEAKRKANARAAAMKGHASQSAAAQARHAAEAMKSRDLHQSMRELI